MAGENIVEGIPKIKAWMRGVLLISSIFMLAWGVFVYNFPNTFYYWVSESSAVVPSQLFRMGQYLWIQAILLFLSALYPQTLWYLLWIALVMIGAGIIIFFQQVMDVATKKSIFFALINGGLWIIPHILIAVRIHLVRNK